MPFVNRLGTRIHYAIRGDEGPAVVLIQGLGLSSRFWFDVPERLREGRDGPRRVIVVDNRGTGRSGRPDRWPPLTLGMMADDVAAVLEDAGAGPAIVVGISMGGMIAQHVALRHPERVRGLVLLATTPGFLAGQWPDPASLYRLLSLPFGGRRASRNLVRLLLPRSKWERAREIFKDWPVAMAADPTPPATFVAHLFAASRHHVAPHLGRIDCPAIVATGEGDLLVPKGNAEALARLLRNAELNLLPDVGHALFAEDRDIVNRLVTKLEGKLG